MSVNLSDGDLLRRLGAGERIADICREAGISREAFDQWWRETTRSRVPAAEGRRTAKVRAAVSIRRDRWGIPHIFADNDRDLLFGFGYAMAQDRLFQLDYLRRKGLGRLAEILGPAGLELDTIARTVGLNRIAAAEWKRLAPDVRQTLEDFSAGINALIADSGDRLPIEFDLLDYRPEPWSPIDCLAIENEFRWYLTGRFPIICMPELARRTLGEGPLYEEYLLAEADDESILWPGEYVGRISNPSDESAGRIENPSYDMAGQAMNDPEAGIGSNNWVLSGRRTTTGQPLLASDPHIAFEAVSCWYEAHLCGGLFNVAGMAYVGMPAIMFGRNERIAWGITNNICSLRDLYQEQTDPAHPGCFLFDGDWEPARELTEMIQVRGAAPVMKTIRFSRNGPVVDELLPKPADKQSRTDSQSVRQTGGTDFQSVLPSDPVTLRWLGSHEGGWLTALLGMDRAATLDEFRQAIRPWHVPLFSLVIADIEGHIAYQAAGRIPQRSRPERGYRCGADPADQWLGVIPFDGMPHVIDPPRGWVATANNRLAPADYPYPLFGCWQSGWRAMRIRQMIESREKLSRDDMAGMHQDAVSLRAAACVPALVNVLAASDDPQIRQAADHLRVWDNHCEPDSVATAIFNVFFTQWCRVVAAERFEPDAVELMSKGVESCAMRLLRADPQGWFRGKDVGRIVNPSDKSQVVQSTRRSSSAAGRIDNPSYASAREQRIVEAMRSALDTLTARLGPDMSQWTWGRLHVMPLRHVLSSRGDLGQLLDHGGASVRGDMSTVCNTGGGPDWSATTGAGYRLIADLSLAPPKLLAVDAQSQSGHPGSPHYSDQFETWLAGGYHEIPLDRAEAAKTTITQFVLAPE